MELFIVVDKEKVGAVCHPSEGAGASTGAAARAAEPQSAAPRSVLLARRGTRQTRGLCQQEPGNVGRTRGESALAVRSRAPSRRAAAMKVLLSGSASSWQKIWSQAKLFFMSGVFKCFVLIFLTLYLFSSRLSFFVLQFEDFGKSETEVREHMVQLANFLDSVSESVSALGFLIVRHLGVDPVADVGRNHSDVNCVLTF